MSEVALPQEGRYWPQLAALSLAMLLPSLGTSIANVALPTLATSFGAPMADVQWVVISYLLSVTCFIIPAGRLGDMIGRSRLLLVGMTLFAAASAASAIAPSLWFLIGARAVQGVGAATLCLFAISAIRYDNGGLHRFASSLFNVVSIITTTGYASEDYQLWGPSAVVIFFFLTFIGGCAGSTAGGFKQFRIVVVQQVVVSALTRTFRPHQMVKMQYGRRRLEPTVTESVMVFSLLYTATFIFFAIIYGLYGLDFETAISASATAIPNVGPGLGPVIGPAGNFATLADPIKWMLCFEMIVGRLEMMTVFVLLMPGFWQ
ncbi:MFS transporter [Hoeflea sp.]|uniref:MFS transporter n=1 Tax=Hoeflea sp. TaxID=1940281 RepID=UPI003A931C2C